VDSAFKRARHNKNEESATKRNPNSLDGISLVYSVETETDSVLYEKKLHLLFIMRIKSYIKRILIIKSAMILINKKKDLRRGKKY